MEKISIIIPCYNSSKTLLDVVQEVGTTMESHRDYHYEIVLVNDFSTDVTWNIISDLSKRNPRVKGLDLGRNFGQHAAILAGMNEANGDIVVCLDDDGQTPANEMFKLIQALDEKTDVVYARYMHKQHSFIRNIGSKVNDVMARHLIKKPKDLYISSYFVAKKYVIDNMLNYKNPYPYVIGLVLQATSNIKNVDVNHRERTVGTSGYSIKKLFSLWINGFTSFSVKPLRIATALGFTFAVFGIFYVIYTVLKKLYYPMVPVGWSSLIAAILMTNGVVLIVLGLVGEYIGRIFISINNIPQYVIRERVNCHHEE